MDQTYKSFSHNGLQLPENPGKWIEDLHKPAWDAYFMGMVFLAAMRSPDQETKQGCVIVDWPSKAVLGTGYNGHPRNALPYSDNLIGRQNCRDNEVESLRTSGAQIIELPTKRPDKYPYMVHADTNAAVACQGASNHAVVYLPMPPCEVCLGVLANMPRILVRRIVYLEHRDLPNTFNLARHLPHIEFEQYTGQHPAEVLMNAAIYAMLRTTAGQALSVNSTKTYAGGTK